MSKIFSMIFDRPATEKQKTAIITSTCRISYASLEQMVLDSARALNAAGIRRNTCVALDVQDEVRHLVLAIAMCTIGCAHFPIQAGEIRSFEEKSGIRFSAALTCADGQPPKVAVSESDPTALCGFLLQTSSGTTGRKKLSILTDDVISARHSKDQQILPFIEGDIYHSLVKVNFTVAKERVLYALMSGVTAFFENRDTDIAGRLKNIVDHRLTYVSCVASQATMLATAARSRDDYPCLRVFRVGASVVPERTREMIRNRLTRNLFINYGTNEAGTISIASPEDQASTANTVGRPAASLAVQIVDRNAGVLPPGKPGLIRISGPSIISGYLHPAEASAASFEDGWFHPGDIVSMKQDGCLVFHGRSDDMMVFDGVNIYPIEIEDCLLSHPDVDEAFAFAFKSDLYYQVPAAIVSMKTREKAGELYAYTRRKLGIACPKVIFAAAGIPKNDMGKPDKAKIFASLKDFEKIEPSSRERQ